ncbi:MAG TPA: hypothetical protein VHR41_17225 [Gemmatimonadales bacterium]|jgi:N-acetylneuraminic acid mutarotase|nr:hypothetical protein [Gemmatimonadales bacterium]
MSPRPPLILPLLLSLFAVLSCGEDTTPTQPGSTDDQISAATASTASNSWTDKAARPGESLYGFVGGVAPNSAGQSILYTFGGVNDEGGSGFPIQAYNAATNSWSTKTSEVYMYDLNGVAKIGSKLYFSGGRSHDGTGDTPSVPTTWAYDYTNDRLTRKADMPKATSEGVTGVIDGKMYVLPGFCDGTGWPFPGYCDHSAIRQLFRYDPVNNKWGALRSCPHYHPFGAGGVINGKFYVAGGLGTAALDVFDPATDSWSPLAPVPTAGRAIGTILGQKLYVITASDSHTYAYDPGTNTWKARAPYPSAGLPLALGRVALDGRNYLVGVDGAGSHLYTP